MKAWRFLNTTPLILSRSLIFRLLLYHGGSLLFTLYLFLNLECWMLKLSVIIASSCCSELIKYLQTFEEQREVFTLIKNSKPESLHHILEFNHGSFFYVTKMIKSQLLSRTHTTVDIKIPHHNIIWKLFTSSFHQVHCHVVLFFCILNWLASNLNWTLEQKAIKTFNGFDLNPYK